MPRSRVAPAVPVLSSQAPPDRIVLSVEATTRKNERHQPVLRRGFKGKMVPAIILSPEYRAFVSLVAEEARRLGIPPIKSGRWRLTVYTTWPRLRHLDKSAGQAGDFPFGDSDAALSGVKDALQEAGALTDDMRIVSDATFNLYEPDVRRIVVVLERCAWDPFSPGEEYAALLAEVAATRQSEAYKRRTAEFLIDEKVKAAKKTRPRRKATKRPAKKAQPNSTSRSVLTRSPTKRRDTART